MSDERQENNPNNPWWGEHIHRYNEALKLLFPAQKVLDIACGSGFGSMLLADAGHRVIGGDISEETINYCKNKYQHACLSFITIDGTNMPFSNEEFDALISFETIEHTTEYNKLLTEFKRVVKSNGTIIISTPNFLINSPDGVIINPYHTQEWKYEELFSLLNSHFSKVTIWGQEYSRYKDEDGKSKGSYAKIIENMLYSRFIRKIPVPMQDRIMKFISNKPIYPLANDYQLTENIDRIVKCKTFYALCKP